MQFYGLLSKVYPLHCTTERERERAHHSGALVPEGQVKQGFGTPQLFRHEQTLLSSNLRFLLSGTFHFDPKHMWFHWKTWSPRTRHSHSLQSVFKHAQLEKTVEMYNERPTFFLTHSVLLCLRRVFRWVTYHFPLPFSLLPQTDVTYDVTDVCVQLGTHTHKKKS